MSTIWLKMDTIGWMGRRDLYVKFSFWKYFNVQCPFTHSIFHFYSFSQNSTSNSRLNFADEWNYSILLLDAESLNLKPNQKKKTWYGNIWEDKRNTNGRAMGIEHVLFCVFNKNVIIIFYKNSQKIIAD